MNFTTRTFGIELEMIVPSAITATDLTREFASIGVELRSESYNHSTRPHWKLVTDGSVRPHRAGFWGIELVSPVLSGEPALEVVTKVCELLTRLGVTTNRTCGFHVHHGARDLKPKHLENLFSLYRNCERAIDTLMPLSRRANANYFCKSLKQKSVAMLQHDRYHKVNLSSMSRHGTVEIRHHSGTVSAEKVVSWIRLTQAMVERSKRKVNSVDHDYSWYDVKQILGMVHSNTEVARKLAAYYDARRDLVVSTRNTARATRRVARAENAVANAVATAMASAVAQTVDFGLLGAVTAPGVENRPTNQS